VWLGGGGGARPHTPTPQPPNPQSPIPNFNILIINSYIFKIYNCFTKNEYKNKKLKLK